MLARPVKLRQRGIAETMSLLAFPFVDTEVLTRHVDDLLTRHEALPFMQDLIELSIPHGLAGLVYSNLRRADRIEYLAPEQGHLLRVSYLKTALENAARMDALTEIETRLSQAGIPHMRFKGCALLGDIYEDFGVRPMSDTDLLLPRRSIPRASEVLKPLGYSLADADELDPHSRASRRTYHAQLVLEGPSGSELLELHWDLTAPETLLRPIHLDTLKMIQASDCHRPRVEDHLLLLAVHFSRHGFRGLIWAMDIALLTRKYQGVIRWDVVVDEAKAAGAASVLYIALLSVQEWTGGRAQIPASVLLELRPHRVRRTLFRAWARKNRQLELSAGPPAFKFLFGDRREDRISTIAWATWARLRGRRPADDNK